MSKIPLPPDKELLPFQEDAIFGGPTAPIGIIQLNNVLLGDEMGLGKTIVGLATVNYYRLTNPDLKVLVVCPNHLWLNWYREAQGWLVIPIESTDEVVCTSQLYIPGASWFVIASYEGVKRWSKSIEYADYETKRPWDLLIVDEAHYCKTPNAQRTLATFAIKASKKIYMTGTPILNYPHEIFPLAHSLDDVSWPEYGFFEANFVQRGSKYGRNLEKLQKLLRFGNLEEHATPSLDHCVCGDHRNSHKVTTIGGKCSEPGCSHTHQVSSWRCNAYDWKIGISCKCTELKTPGVPRRKGGEHEIRPIMIRRLKKEVDLQLPRKRRQVIEIPALGALRDLAEKEKDLWKKLYAEEDTEALDQSIANVVEGGGSEEDFARIVESLAVSKSVIFAQISIVRHQLALAKVPDVIEHINTVLDSKDKVVVFTHHKDVAKQICDGINEYLTAENGGESYAVYATGDESVPERDASVRKLQEDENCRALVGTMGAVGTGFTMTAAAHIVFAELDWTPSKRTQAEDRCHRIGQEHSLLVQYVVVEDSMDSYIAHKTAKKERHITKAIG